MSSVVVLGLQVQPGLAMVEKSLLGLMFNEQHEAILTTLNAHLSTEGTVSRVSGSSPVNDDQQARNTEQKSTCERERKQYCACYAHPDFKRVMCRYANRSRVTGLLILVTTYHTPSSGSTLQAEVQATDGQSM